MYYYCSLFRGKHFPANDCFLIKKILFYEPGKNYNAKWTVKCP